MTYAAASFPTLRAKPSPALPVDRLVVGKRTDEVAVLIPRLFSLCRAAQGAAVATCLGRPADPQGIAQEILRDHMLKICVTWPNLLGLAPRSVPLIRPAAGAGISPDTPGSSALPTSLAGEKDVAEAAFGALRRPPATSEEFEAFLASGTGAAPVLARIDACFAAGEACANALPPVDAISILGGAPVENSNATRHLDHPVMRHIETMRGRGPLWRATARLYDIAMALDDTLPAIALTGPGQALVPATRGAYAMRIDTDGEIVTHFARVTPTDSLIAPGGVLDRSLATLPADKSGLWTLLLNILDPCSPVRLESANA